jgi:hypothetical protein
MTPYQQPRFWNFLDLMVGPTELESVTSCVSSRRSNQLSYGPERKQKTYYWNSMKYFIDDASSSINPPSAC